MNKQMIEAREILARRRLDALSSGGASEITVEEIDAVLSAYERLREAFIAFDDLSPKRRERIDALARAAIIAYERALAADVHPPLPITSEWRCINCKQVTNEIAEPERCTNCRASNFAHIITIGPMRRSG